MAETLTVDPTPPAEIVGESDGVQLTADEQDSLAVGEQIVEQQEQLLAGKYKNAEELEKAYVELQGKLGEQGKENETEDNTEAEQEEVLSETSEEGSKNYSEGAQLIETASDEYWNNGEKLSPETMEKFSSMSAQDLVSAYMEVSKNNPPQQEQDVADISDATVNQIKNYAGGEKAYQDMVDWASTSLDANSVQAFDSIINSGSVDAIKLAVNGLKSQYDLANGVDGEMVTGKAPSSAKDVYRSQAELVEAMSDRRYDNDPAYRQDVIEKLERSGNLQF